ncbi:hypothetical protein DAI21_10105 [Lelliottia sp. WB101]|uniref:hypothetical protein n=1 Tax=Lelliottia sp. WB101 TaxID=2153385 RepID=UPI000D22417C|nr:hypothetical protein [Lelliottia sp. WB101]AVY97987.1 hypothetical protein DAI21_10105 [Lelliottia sp. WB101]
MGIAGFSFCAMGEKTGLEIGGQQGLSGLKGSDLIRFLRTSWDKFKAQKSPQGLRRAGFQDFIG